MDSLPAEIAAIIAVGAPAILHTCRRFATVLQCQHARYDIMIAAGYSVSISESCITWYRRGLVHGPPVGGGPAHEYLGVCTVWYKNGQRHRENGPAYISHSSPVWSMDDRLRFDMYPPGSQLWYYRGKIHRLDGPAVVDGANVYWYVDGEKYTKYTHAFAAALWTLRTKLNW